MDWTRRLDEADRFVLESTRAFARGQPVAAAPAAELWVERAERAGVLSAIGWALHDAGHDLPRDYRAMRIMHAAVEMAAIRDAHGLGEALDAAGIPWAVVKGPVLSRVVYRVEGARDYSDLDVLVPPSRFAAAVQALVASGAALVATDWDHLNRNRTAELGLVLPGGTLLDLHWHLVNIGRIRDGFGLDTDELLSRRTVRQVGAFRLPTLHDLDLVLHVLLHAALSGGHRLRWLLDAQQSAIWLTEERAAALGSRAQELGVAVPARVVLDRAARFVDERVSTWAEAVQPPSSWSRLAEGMSRWTPPSLPSARLPSSRLWLASSRPTSRSSFRELARASAAEARHHWSARTAPDRAAVTLDDSGLRRWLDQAGQEGSSGRHLT